MPALVMAVLLAAAALAGCGGGGTEPAANEPAAQEPVKEETAAPSGSGEAEPADGADAAEAEDEEDGGEETVAKAEVDPRSTDFTFLTSVAENSYFYEEYEDNEVVQYWLNRDWEVDGNPYRVSIDFSALPAGSEKDVMSTLIATGEYQDVISMTYSSDTATALYEEGVVLDLTDLVAQYMPNYSKWMEEHPEYAARMRNNVDGADRIIQLFSVGDAPEAPFSGYLYRRDWLVKYGKNPETGKAFTGGWQDDERLEWEDDVVFPSGNTDPVYISDWEWMFDIFQEAIKGEGITEDGYAFQLYYAGDNTVGGLTSSFTGGNSYYYLDADGKCQYGFTGDGYRAYIECMREWYSRGYTNQNFEENTDSALFWKVDDTATFSGKVGLWYGTSGCYGNTLAVDTDVARDMCAYGAPYPINDVYGDASCQGHNPCCFLGGNTLTEAFCVTDKAADKNLPALLTALDYLYTREGGLLHSRGFSKEQAEETQSKFYQEWDLMDGAYSFDTIDGEEWLIINPSMNVEGVKGAAAIVRVCGLIVNDHVDLGYNPVGRKAHEQWIRYENSGYITSEITGQLSADVSAETSINTSNIRTYIAMKVPDFITGRADIKDDAAWQDFCKGLEEFHPETYRDAINAVLGF